MSTGNNFGLNNIEQPVAVSLDNHDEVNANQSLEYELWVSQLGHTQDGVFQNTPTSNHITSNFNFQSQSNHFNSFNIDLNNISLMESPSRIYRDLFNESPAMNRTPLVGRTPLRNLNIDLSTPSILKAMETGITPLKNNLAQNVIFKTPEDQKQNSTLDSSPTTIKMNSSAIKTKGNSSLNNEKILHSSPTRPKPQGNQTQQEQLSIPNQHGLPDIPKMGFFKKQEPSPPPKQTRKVKPLNTTYQFVMADASSYGKHSKSVSKPKKKKLARSSTSANVTSTPNIISKKTTLKRVASLPQTKTTKAPEQMLNSSTNILNVSLNKDAQSEISVVDIFDDSGSTSTSSS